MKLVNDSSNVINTVINCAVSDSRYMDIYTDKSLYVIDEGSSVGAKIIIKLKNKTIVNDLNISYNCSIVSTTN